MAEPILIKVAKTSEPELVAGAIAGFTRDNADIIVQAIGSEALHLAVKALILADRYLVEDGVSLTCRIRYQSLGPDYRFPAIKFEVVPERNAR